MLGDDRIDKFIKLIQDNGEKRFVILGTHIDPDFMGASIGAKKMIRKILDEKVDVRIYYCGSLGMKQNNMIMTKYDLEDDLKKSDEFEPEKHDFYILVDAPQLAAKRVPLSWRKLEPSITIDHHRAAADCDEDDSTFIWIEKIGACCTQIYELATHKKIGINLSHDECRSLSSLIALGIHTDTNKLTTSTARDDRAFAAAKEHIEDKNEFFRLVNYSRPKSFFDNWQAALRSKKIKGSKMVAGLGEISQNETVDLSQIAHGLLRWEGITMVAVWAVVGNSIQLSVKSDDLGVPLHEYLTDLFGAGSSGAKPTSTEGFEGGSLISADLGEFGSNFLEQVKDNPDVKEKKIALLGEVVEAMFLKEPE